MTFSLYCLLRQRLLKQKKVLFEENSLRILFGEQLLRHIKLRVPGTKMEKVQAFGTRSAMSEGKYITMIRAM